MGDLAIAADIKRDLPVPVGHIQKPVMKDEGSVLFNRRPSWIREGATKVVVAILGPFSIRDYILGAYPLRSLNL